MLSFFHTHTPSPILLELGPITLYWYGLFYLIAILVGYYLGRHLLQKNDEPWAQKLLDELPEFVFGLVVSGIVGARLYHVINEWRLYAADPWQIFALGNGGLAIHGALIAGLLFLWWYVRRLPTSYFLLPTLLDFIAPIVLLGQSLGRWGNYFNQELFGRPTNLPWGIPISPEHRPAELIDATHFHPTFLYESLWDLIGVALLFYLQYSRKASPPAPQSLGGVGSPGSIAALYLIWMATGRFLVELLRVDRTPLVFGIRLPLLVSAGLVLVGLITFASIARKRAV